MSYLQAIVTFAGTDRRRVPEVSLLAAGHGAPTAPPSEPPPDRRSPSLRALLLWTFVPLAAAVVLQVLVYGRGGHEALGDIPGRFYAWRLGPNALPYIDRPVEYPVVIGSLGFATAWVARTATAFFVATGVINIALALLMTVLLWSRRGSRIWRWLLGVPVALYALHNWDLVAMVPAIIGLYAFESGRDRLSGVALAFGASAKVFPGLLVPPLVAARWCSGDRRGAVRLLAAAAVTTLVLNLPVAVVSWSGWRFPLTFQAQRDATWGSLWSWVMPGIHALVGADAVGAVNALAVLALAAALVVISVLAVRRHLDAVEIGAAVVGVFLLTNKIYSPNYDLWLVPFFVLLPIARRVWIGYCASDLAIFVFVYGGFHGLWSHGTVVTVMPALVATRALTIVAVVATALRARRNLAGLDEVHAAPASAGREPVGVFVDARERG